MIEVPFLGDQEIEEAAEELIASFSRSKSPINAAPVPVERLISFLGLSQEIDDLYKLMNIERGSTGDLLGALCVETKRVFVHDEVDPDVYPWREGRFNFTLAHEVAHWVLHRAHISISSDQLSLLGDTPSPAIICRSSDRIDRIEVQANKFASCVLMPRKLISEAWQRHTGLARSPSQAQNDAAIKAVAQKFRCSIQATRIRIAALGLLDAGRSPGLAL